MAKKPKPVPILCVRIHKVPHPKLRDEISSLAYQVSLLQQEIGRCREHANAIHLRIRKLSRSRVIGGRSVRSTDEAIDRLRKRVAAKEAARSGVVYGPVEFGLSAADRMKIARRSR